MSDVKTIAVSDMDGVLLDLHLDSARLRGTLDALAGEHGCKLEGRGLLTDISAICTELGKRDPAAGERLHQRLWALIDEEELRCAPNATLHPGAREFLAGLGDTPVALYTNNHLACALTALRAVGIDPDRFFAITARPGPASIKPAAAPLLDLLAHPLAAGAQRVFMVGDHGADMGSVTAARATLPAGAAELIGIGHAHRMEDGPRLESAGADFVVTEVSDAAALITAPRSPHSLSMVLLALNEQDSIEAAIRDCRRFGRLWLSGYQVVVVDDGSTDATAARAEAASQGDVHVIRHQRNLGMGAAMRSGYAAARCDYIAHLPADRQVRPQSLLAFLPLVRPTTTVVSTYVTPPSGQQRRLMSMAFRLIVQGLGGMRVNFAGTYVFHRRWLDQIDLGSVRCETFVFSFELLERLHRAGSSFAAVTIRPFMREIGQSREVAVRRIVRVFREIARYRARALKARLT